jgi:transcriptional regulator with XRE-family HTH domain
LSIGQAIKDLRDRHGLTQENFGKELHISKQLVSHIENDRRKMHESIAEKLLEEYDDPYLNLTILREFSRGYTAPQVNGKYIDWENRLVLNEVAKQEAKEVIELLQSVNLIKPPHESTKEEIERIEKVAEEITEAEWMLHNLKAKLASAYGISIKEINKRVEMKWRAKGWIE